MKNKNTLILILTILVILAGFAAFGRTIFLRKNSLEPNPTTTSSVKFVESTVTATGAVTAKNQAKLSFQTPGELVYLPFKEGDSVEKGDILAKLNTTSLNDSFVAAQESYKAALAAKDSAVEQRTEWLEVNQDKQFTDVIRAQRSQKDAAVRSATANAEVAKAAMDVSQSALSNATLVTPFDGVVTHEDVTITGVNIVPTTSFTVSDPDSIVFRANVPISSIYYVSPGANVSLAIDGFPEKIEGTVSDIYPSKVTLSNGQSAYQVDIVSQGLSRNAKFDQTGTAIINTNVKNVALVPAWTVLDGSNVWVEVDGSPELKKVETGKIHGNEVEIVSGLSTEDKVIVDPKYIKTLNYKIL